MLKPSTIKIQDFMVDHLRALIRKSCDKVISAVSHAGIDGSSSFQMSDVKDIPQFMLRPIIGGEVDPRNSLDRLDIMHAQFSQFDMNEKNPQISCHMIGHVRWNTNMQRELVSIRWRFNLYSPHKTNAYVTYL